MRAIRLLLLLLLTGATLTLDVSISHTVEIPETLHRREAIGADVLRSRAPKRLPLTATHLGFSWKGDSEWGPQIRTSPDSVTWSDWQPIEASDDLSDPNEGLFFSPLQSTSGVNWIQIRSDQPTIRDVHVTTINTKDGPKRRLSELPSASAATPNPAIVTREQWGANESLRKGTPSFARVTKIFVHHTVTSNNDPDPMGTIRAIYSYHTQSRGWNDIGYNFLIDWNGNVYEGRWARNFGQGETHTGEDLNGMGVIGAQVSNHNTGSMGVALLGDFSSTAPSTAATQGARDLIAWKADRFGINPLGNDPYFNRVSGQWETFPNLAGHRDADSTACPGGQLYSLLPQLRQDVENRIQQTTFLSGPSMPTGTELTPSNPSTNFTPAARGAVSRTASRIEITFRHLSSNATRTLSTSPSNGSFGIDGGNYEGVPLAEGLYSINAVAYDSQGLQSSSAVVASSYRLITPTSGYWMVASDGGIFTYGNAVFYGSMGGRSLAKPIVGMEVTKPKSGYWLVASDGGIFSFGSNFYGSTGGMSLRAPIVGMERTESGAGYWLVASDGGIFSFGDASFFGSTGAMTLKAPIVGMASTPTGNGYWLVASDGGIFSFGDASFFGSTGAMTLKAPIVGMASTPTGNGYWLVASDGGIFSFGDAGFYGSMGNKTLAKPIVGMTATSKGRGYWMVASDGGIFSFGDAIFYGSMGGKPLAQPIVGLAN